MAFVVVFVIIALAFPLSLEVWRTGGDNILSRSAREVADTDLARAIASHFQSISALQTQLASPDSLPLDSVVGGALALIAVVLFGLFLTGVPAVVARVATFFMNR